MPLKFSRFIALVAFFVMVTASSAVFAQEGAVRDLNAQGMQAFADGRFTDAAEMFGRAYALDPRPELLKNQAVAWYKAERCSEAVESAHQFLTAPGATERERAETQALLGACKVRLAQEAIEVGSFDLAEQLLTDVEKMNPDAVLADRINFVRVELAKKRAAVQRGEDEAVQAQMSLIALDDPELTLSPIESVERRDTDVVADRKPPGEEKANVAGWPLIVFGIASITGGVVYHVIAATSLEPEFHDVAKGGTDRTRYDELDRALRTANVLVPTLYVLGGLFTATGVFLTLRPPSSPDHDDGSVVLGISGEFR